MMSSEKTRIAIIGAGISGLTAAYYLDQKYDVTIFESRARVGGHANTVVIDTPNGKVAVDTGFIVYNHTTYPYFCRLLADLGVKGKTAPMHFGVVHQQTGLEYATINTNSLFAQRRNLLRPRFLGMIREIVRFHRVATKLLRQRWQGTVHQFVRDFGFSQYFYDNYLLPLGGSLWSSPAQQFANFSMLFVVAFLHNHAMLQSSGQHAWYTIDGGSARYVEALMSKLQRPIRVQCAIDSIERKDDGVVLRSQQDSWRFDEVIAACHADTAFGLLTQPSSEEVQWLSTFAYAPNEVFLHSDTSVMPKNKRAWAAWNYRVGGAGKPQITYWMNRLQSLPTDTPVFVSLNLDSVPNKHKVWNQYVYRHPQFTMAAADSQQHHKKLIRHDRISYCGAYWGNGFHEDGVASALKVVAAFGVTT